MTPHETAALLVVLNANWPYVEVGEATSLLWAEQLADIHPGDAMQTARLLIRSPGRFPSVGEFLETARPITRRRLDTERQTTRPVGELESGEHLSREERKANVARLVAETKKVVDANRARSRRLRPQV